MSEIDPIYKELAAILRAEDSKYMPRILEKLANLEQARIIRELPSSSEEIAKKLNLDKETVDKHVQELMEKGLLVPTRKGPQMIRSFLQFHDTQSNPKFDESLGDEYFELWDKLQYEEMFDTLVELLAVGERPTWRIIPRWKSIKDIPGVLPWEDVRGIFKAQETIALIHCCCKRIHRKRECGTPDEVCISLGRAAQYNINRGAGRKLTVKEALDVVTEMDKYQVVNLTTNQKEVNQVLCNCHWCCCDVLLSMFKQGKYELTQGIAKSRFETAVDVEKCIGCKTCVTRCQFGAAQMKYYPEFGEERAYIDTEKCMGCGCCVISCSAGARAMKLVRPPEHIPDMVGGIY